MGKRQMNEYEFVEEIVRTTRSIRNLYNQLCSLNSNGKENSPEFKQYLSYLRISIEVEEELYQECPDYLGCLDLLDQYIGVSEKNEDIIISGFEESEDSLVKKRIQERLSRRVNLKGSFYKLFQRLGSQNIDEDADEVDSMVNLLNDVATEIKKAFVVIVKQELDNNFIERVETLQFLYNLTFRNQGLETYLIANDFILPDEFNFSDSIYSIASGIAEDEISTLKESYVIDTINRSISALAAIDDSQIINGKKLTLAHVLSCAIRAGLVFLGKEDCINITQSFRNFIQLKRMIGSKTSNILGESYVFMALEKSESDQKTFIKIRRN